SSASFTNLQVAAPRPSLSTLFETAVPPTLRWQSRAVRKAIPLIQRVNGDSEDCVASLPETLPLLPSRSRWQVAPRQAIRAPGNTSPAAHRSSVCLVQWLRISNADSPHRPCPRRQPYARQALPWLPQAPRRRRSFPQNWYLAAERPLLSKRSRSLRRPFVFVSARHMKSLASSATSNAKSYVHSPVRVAQAGYPI